MTPSLLWMADLRSHWHILCLGSLLDQSASPPLSSPPLHSPNRIPMFGLYPTALRIYACYGLGICVDKPCLSWQWGSSIIQAILFWLNNKSVTLLEGLQVFGACLALYMLSYFMMYNSFALTSVSYISYNCVSKAISRHMFYLFIRLQWYIWIWTTFSLFM